MRKSMSIIFAICLGIVLSGCSNLKDADKIGTEDKLETVEQNDFVYSIEDYGNLTEIKKEFVNDNKQETYYYRVETFYFSDKKYSAVNETLQQMYNQIISEYEKESECYVGDYVPDLAIENEIQRLNDCEFVFNYISYVGEDYVSLVFNNCIYWAGAAHPQSYYEPITVNIQTGEIATPEEILGMNWDNIRSKGNIEIEDENVFNGEYGFYITAQKLIYIYRTNYYVENIEILR